MSVNSEIEAKGGDPFHAWRGTGVSLPHFSCNRFLAQPLLPTLDFPRSLHVATNRHLRWRGQSSLACRFPFPTLWPPMATETGNAASAQPCWKMARPCFRAFPCLKKPSPALPAGAGTKRQIQFPPAEIEQERKGISYLEKTAIKYRAHAQLRVGSRVRFVFIPCQTTQAASVAISPLRPTARVSRESKVRPALSGMPVAEK